jgi:hypothetical protein
MRALMFTGTRFTRAKAKGTGLRGKDRPPILSVFSDFPGKAWTVDKAEGWWRDFAGLDLADEKQVVTFVRKHGFLFPDSERQEFTDRWPDLQTALKTIEAAWEPLDANGDSEILDFGKVVETVRAYQRDITITRLMREMRVAFDPKGRTVLQAQTLPGYMVFSALAGLQAAIDKESTAPMRRCQWCGSFFYRPRRDALFDSPSCRARANERAKIAAE